MKEKIRRYLPWLVFAAVALSWILFYLLRVERLLDADMSSEMVLSRILADEHRIITPNWKYSTEIRVLNNQIFFSLFLALTGSFRISRLLSGVVLLLLYGASFYYLCVQAGIKKYFPYGAALLFLPFSHDYAYIILYGLYYIPHIAISFTTAALVLHFRNAKTAKKKAVFGILLFLLSVAAGVGGPRQIIICYLPLLFVFLLESFRNRRVQLPGALIAFAGGIVGYGINSNILLRSYHFNGWSSLSFTGLSFAKAESLIMGILHEYGYTEGEVFSGDLIKNMAAFLIVGGILLYYIIYGKNREKRGAEERFLADLLLMMTAVYFLLYLFTDMYYEDRYALPFIVFAAPLLAFAWKRADEEKADPVKEEKGKALPWGHLIPAAVITAVFLGGCGRYPGLMRADYTTALKEVTAALAAQGYESGYASYWNGNICTELSEGRFEMFNWDDYVSEKVDVEELYLWLQPIDHKEKKPEGKVFILLSTQEETECPLVRYLTEEDVAFRNAFYVAYGFEDHASMLAALSDYRYDLNDGAWLSGGDVVDGAWILHPGASAAGPNMTFYAGTYEIEIEGDGIERLENAVTAEFGAVSLPVGSVRGAMDPDIARSLRLPEDQAASAQILRQTISVTVPENTYHVELRLSNPSAEDVRITDIIIRRQ